MIEQIRNKFPYVFLVMISAVIVFLYFTFVKLLIIDMDPWPSFVMALFLIVYHIFVILLIWSLIMTIKKDPGLVPIHWVSILSFRDSQCSKELKSTVSSAMYLSPNAPITVQHVIDAF